MMIDVAELRRHGVRPRRIVHAGAHIGQEAKTYRAMGVTDGVLWVEANPNLIEELAGNVTRYGHHVAHALLGRTSGEESVLHVAEADNYSNRGQSSSVLALGTHRDKHPEVSYVADIPMTTLTLDDVVRELDPAWLTDGVPLMVNADLQGFEGDVFAGAPDTLAAASWVMSEVNIDELYVGCTLLGELDALLVAAGFELAVVTTAGCRRRDCSDGGNRWVGWGDGLWVRTPNPRPWGDTHPDDAADWFNNIERADA